MSSNGRRRSPAPRGLGNAGKRLWASILDTYSLAVHEELILLEACRTADRLDVLAGVGADAATTVENRFGEQVTAPHLVESRQQAVVLTRLIASLRLPDDAGEDAPAAAGGPAVTGDVTPLRPQRRGGARGAYGPRTGTATS